MIVDVQNLVTLLSNNIADQTLFVDLFNDVMATLGPDRWHTNAVPITFTAGNPEMTLPSTLLDLVQLIYDDTALSHLELRELEALNTGWRNMTGNPRAYTTESENVKIVALYPVPYRTSPPIIPVHGLATGEDYAPGNGISIHSELRSVELPYLTLPIALRILEREFMRESDHQDQIFAQFCKALADLLLEMLK